MIWRENLPARVALVTTGLLALVMLVITGAAYTITAFTIRRGVDAALLSVLPAADRDLYEFEERFGRGPGSTDRRLQELDLHGNRARGSDRLPVDQQAVATARANGSSFASVLLHDGQFVKRPGPEWLQALTPDEHEYRVMYAVRGDVVVQLAEPLGPIAQTLPTLVRWMALLTLVGVAAAGLIAFRMASTTYRPLRAITDTADQVTTQTLSVRVPDVWRDKTLRRLTGVLNAMIARLQESFEAQGRFVSAAAHELRTPLGAMRAELEVALRRERTPAEYREALTGAVEEVERLSSLSERLLILARYEHGASWTMESDLPVADLLTRAVHQVRRANGGDVTVSVAEDLLVDGDPVALERVVSNLVRNALEAGGAPVRVEAADSGTEVTIRVSDQGPGIPAESIPRLFEPFYRGDPSRKADGGTGLGLAIVKTVVDAHGGSVNVESKPDNGSVFTVRLPRHRSQSK